jgi:DNA polymerase-1
MGAGAMAYNARAKERTCGSASERRGSRRQCGIEKADLGAGQAEDGLRRVHRGRAQARQLARRVARAADELFEMAGAADEAGRGETRRRRGPRFRSVVRGQCGYTQWLNTPFQGLGATSRRRDVPRQREMYTDRRSPLWGSHLVLNVHDELIAELPRGPRARGRRADGLDHARDRNRVPARPRPSHRSRARDLASCRRA